RLAPDLAATAARGLGPRSDVPALLGAADALVLTSDSEGCPNVVLEALAAGTPVVAADVGDIRDMVAPGETGFVVPAGDPDRYVEALCEVIARRDSFAARVAARRQALAERWGVPAMVERTIALWAELARPGAAPPAEPRDAVTPPDPTPLRPTRSP
ncbi:MAG: glycosyltransferase, partial [Acidobacteria bacterium]